MPKYTVLKNVSALYELEVEADSPEEAAKSCFVPIHGEKDVTAMELNSYDVDMVQVFAEGAEDGADPLYEE